MSNLQLVEARRRSRIAVEALRELVEAKVRGVVEGINGNPRSKFR